MPITTQSAAVAAVTALAQSAAMYGDSAALANQEPTDNSVAIRDKGVLFQSTGLAGGPTMAVAVSAALTADSTVATAAGQATIVGAYVGTPVWALEVDATGKYAIHEATGAITVAATLTATTDTIEVAVTGLTPVVANVSASIVVGAGT